MFKTLLIVNLSFWCRSQMLFYMQYNTIQKIGVSIKKKKKKKKKINSCSMHLIAQKWH